MQGVKLTDLIEKMNLKNFIRSMVLKMEVILIKIMMEIGKILQSLKENVLFSEHIRFSLIFNRDTIICFFF